MSHLTRSNTNAAIPFQHSSLLPHNKDRCSDSDDDGDDEDVVDSYLYPLDGSDASDSRWSGDDTPTTPKPVHKQWSDVTLTGRSSFCSWGEDEGVLDRIACETVGYMFDYIDKALYDGCATGNDQLDNECREWSRHFPHFRITGSHLLDSIDDGAEIVEPVITAQSKSTDYIKMSNEPVSGLSIIGKAMVPLNLSHAETTDSHNDNPGLHYEEILAIDGTIEEYLAYSDDCEEKNNFKHVSNHRQPHHLPPVTPSECVRDTVCSFVFDQLWSEVSNVLQPLLLKYQSSQNQGNSSSHTPLSSSNHLHMHNFFLPSNLELPPLPSHSGHYGSLSVKKKRLVSSIPHTTDLPSLQNVMTIKPVALQQRIPSSSLQPYNNHLSTTSITGSLLIHDPYRPVFNIRQSHTPHPPEHKMVPTNRLGSRRNPLKPIEISKLSVLPVQDDDISQFNGLIGQKLVRNTQLPPLDKSQLETNKLPRNSGTKGHVTFANRIVSAVVDNNEAYNKNIGHRYTSVGGQNETRPNTTQTFRSETPLHRRGSNQSVATVQPSASPIKIIGHAASIHNDLILWEENNDASDIVTSPRLHKSLLPLTTALRSKTTRYQTRQ